MSQDILVQVHSKKCLHGCRLDFPDWLLRLIFLNVLLPLGVGGSEGGAFLVSVSNDRYSRAGLLPQKVNNLTLSLNATQINMVKE